MGDVPMSVPATVAIISGSLIAITFSTFMLFNSDQPSPYEDVLVQERMRGDVLSRDNLVLLDRLDDTELELDECLGLTYECAAVRLPLREIGLPPKSLDTDDNVVVLDEIVVEAVGWEAEFGLPPKTLGRADELKSYLNDNAQDGEVLPGPEVE